MDKAFFRGKRVLVRGHTGFKGTWLCKLLDLLGAEVYMACHHRQRRGKRYFKVALFKVEIYFWLVTTVAY